MNHEYRVKTITVSAKNKNWDNITRYIRIQLKFVGHGQEAGPAPSPYEVVYIEGASGKNYTTAYLDPGKNGLKKDQTFWLHDSVKHWELDNYEHKHFPEKDESGLIYDPDKGEDYYIEITDRQGHYTKMTTIRPMAEASAESE